MAWPKGMNQIMDYSANKHVTILYKTKIVEYDLANRTLTLNSGARRTFHTKKCMNLALQHTPYKVFQRNRVWYVTDGITVTEFQDNMQLCLP